MGRGNERGAKTCQPVSVCESVRVCAFGVLFVCLWCAFRVPLVCLLRRCWY